MKAAEAFFNQRDVEKALENWSRVSVLDPENIMAHSRLAVVHERLGQNQPAVTEYLAIASILQRSGKGDKAQEIVTRALQFLPQSPEARQAQSLLKTGQLLPKPIRPKGAT
jgi:Tfp pilus assembly protein PilF